MKKKDIAFVFSQREKQYADAQTELIYHTPFQLVVAVVLSAQTTDKQVNRVTASFFDTLRQPEDLVALPFSQREQMISSINYYKTKAKHLYQTAQLLVGTHIPATQEELMRLPGIGEKTAKVIRHVLYNHPVIAVDTHVHRVANRLGLVSTKSAEQTSKLLPALVPPAALSFAHHAFILFGRYHCTAKNPACSTCPFATICTWYGERRK